MSKIRRWTVYFGGLFLMAAGVAFSVLSGLGVSPIDTIPYVTSVIFHSDMGLWTAIIFACYVGLQAVILRRDFPRRNILQIPIGICFGWFVSVTNTLESALLPAADSYPLQLLYLLLSMVLIGFGISFYVEADLMRMPAEGVAQAIAAKTGWQLSSSKILFDWSVVAVSLLLCWLVLHRLDGIREGTLIAAFGVGLFLRLSQRTLCRGVRRFLHPGGLPAEAGDQQAA